MKDPAYLQKSWDDLSSQVKVDKVYIESYRSGVIADDALLETVKAFFAAHGVEAAGGIAYAAGGDIAGFRPRGRAGTVRFVFAIPTQNSATT